MIQGYDILCFAPGPWDDIWRNRHHIMTRLARSNRVLYIEPWAYLYPTMRRWVNGDLRTAEWTGQRLTQVLDQLHVYRPPPWVPRAEGLIGKLTWGVYRSFLRRAIRQLGFRRPILWLFSPDTGVFVGQFDEQLVIYHVVDEYAAYSGVSANWRPVVQKMERQLARRADLLFVTSPGLLASKQPLNPRVILVPNAVDYPAFETVRESGAPPPDDVDSGGRAVAGYVGAINDKVDLELLAHLTREMTDWVFLLVGPVSTDGGAEEALVDLRSRPNVRMLGRKDVADVPRYIMACDVCLLPYRVNDWTRNIDSLKLYEYLACGKPVVASPVPSAQRHEDLVVIAETPDGWARAIMAARSSDGALPRRKRQELAAKNNWDERVEALSTAIAERMGKAEQAPGL